MPQFKLNPYLKGNHSIVSPQVTGLKHNHALIDLAQRSVVALSIYGLGLQLSYAEDNSAQSMQLPVLVIEAQKQSTADPLQLKQVNSTGSRLGLTAQETPATVQTITQEDLQEKGLRTVKEAFGNVTGATVGNVPGNPAVLTMRGFSGNANTVLQDGVRVGASTFVTRDLDVWKYEKIEVLKEMLICTFW